MIFLDTGAFLARHLSRDQHHAAAQRFWDELRRSEERCLTSNFVVDETLTLLGRRATYEFAADVGQRIYDSQTLEILRPTANDERAALELLRKYSDQRVSFTDCVSFALMRAHGIERAFAFDHHFSLAGFERLPLEA